MSKRGLELALEAGQSLPVHLCWRINHGYLRATGETRQGEIFSIGLWGPGEIVIPALFTEQPIELRALSTAKVHEWLPDPSQTKLCTANHVHQMGMLLQLTRIRPAESRLFNLLIWLGKRFGSSMDIGQAVPLEAMNLTHRQLAELASVSRVTVTKSLGHFRQLGWLERAGKVDVLTKKGISHFRMLR